MTKPENISDKEILEQEIGNEALRGFFRTKTGNLWFDRRYTYRAMQADPDGLLRIADLGIDGPIYIAVSDELAAELGYNGGQDGTNDPTV